MMLHLMNKIPLLNFASYLHLTAALWGQDGAAGASSYGDDVSFISDDGRP